MDPYVLAELKAYILTVAAGSGVVAGALASWLGHLVSARILRNEESRQKIKVDLYRKAVEPYIKFFVETKYSAEAPQPKIQQFEADRLRIASELSLYAPQAVMDTFNAMADYVFDAVEGKKPLVEKQVIELGTAFLNAARADIGLGKGDIASYRGHRKPSTDGVLLSP